MELKMITDIESSVPAVIEFNFDEMKTDLESSLEKYNQLVVTEDSISEAKADKANLNKLSKTLNDNRIAQERLYVAPFKIYKGKVDELIALIQKPLKAIDTQIKVFDVKKQEEKLEKINHFYQTNIGSLIDVLPLSKILNPKWMNVGVTILALHQEMIDKIMNVKADFKIIEAMKLDCEVQMKDEYLKNLNMSEALAEKTRFEEQQKRLAELKFEELRTLQKPQIVEPNPVQYYPQDIVEKVEVAFAPPIAEVKQVEETKTIKVIFHDTTQAFRDEIRALTIKHNITYGGVR